MKGKREKPGSNYSKAAEGKIERRERRSRSGPRFYTTIFPLPSSFFFYTLHLPAAAVLRVCVFHVPQTGKEIEKEKARERERERERERNISPEVSAGEREVGKCACIAKKRQRKKMEAVQSWVV